ncbi:MAG: restriction endonuclease subunit S [Phycisphaerae bacterium]|nr:restriction endonuclease subunit S [Phycisphaerae bacterium]
MMRMAALQDVTELNPSTPRELSERPELPVSFVPMTDVGEDGRLHNGQERPVGELLKGYTYFSEGDVLVAKITPCMQNGKAAHVTRLKNKHAFGSTEFHVLRPGPTLDGRYLFYMVWNPAFRHYAEQRFTGSAGQKRVPATAVAEFKIPIPFPNDAKRSLKEQKRIAEILDKADAIRQQRQEAAKLAGDLIPSLFYTTFDDWLRAPVEEMRRLGDEDLADIASGVTKGRRFNGQQTVIVPYIRVANVQDGYLDLSEIKTIEVLPSDVESLRLEHGDVLMTEGGDFDKLGRGTIWEHDVPDCIHQNHIFRVRCNRNLLLPLYFAHYIRSHLGKAYFLRCAKKTSNLATINKTQLRDLPVPLPPIALQKAFAKEVKGIRKIQGRHAEICYAGDDLFNSLAQRAFRGEL